MYTIEYYKTKREKPKVDESESARRKDLVDKCWNIKSLTIDKEDIEHIFYDEELLYTTHLYVLAGRVVRMCKKTDSYSDLTSVVILNNNGVNQTLIYEIINCDWMVNRDELSEELAALKLAKNLCKYIRKYDDINNPCKKEKAKVLLDYYMDTIINIDKPEQKFEGKTLKLGTHIIKPNKKDY